MARITQDREDLLREATALVPRMMLEMEIQALHGEVFVGFRGDSLSVYFGASPVYHFNSVGELRRAFLDDRLIKAESGQLVGSVRERTSHEVALISTPLSPAELECFLAGLTGRLRELCSNLDAGAFTVVGQFPSDSNIIDRLRTWLVNWQGPRVANVANVN
jgi:hypothetical protein